MGKLLLTLLAAFALPTAVNAETRILLQSFTGHTRSIDASSVIKNGSWRYANLRYKGPYGGSITGIKVDCKEKIYIYPDPAVTLTLKRKSKDYWVVNRSYGEEKTNDYEIAEAIYQFLCKEWE